MAPLLSWLVVTRFEPHAVRFVVEMSRRCASMPYECELVVALDGLDAFNRFCDSEILGRPVQVESKGYLESVLDVALASCNGAYVLRLDDDERASDAMARWLQGQEFTHEQHWKFPRTHLVRDDKTVVLTPHLFPDYQTRLSVRGMAGERRAVHAGSPYGGGVCAPVVIEHYKFLCRDLQARLAIAEQYDAFGEGYGTGGMLPFSLPDRAYQGQTLRLIAKGDGTHPWTPEWVRDEVVWP